MRSISLCLLAIFSLGAAETAPDADFTAKVEQAMNAIRLRQADAASADFKALSERLRKAGVDLPASEGRAMTMDLSAVQIRQIRVANTPMAPDLSVFM